VARKTGLLLWALLAAACGAAQKVDQAVGGPERTIWEQESIDKAMAEGRVIRGMTYAEVRKVRGSPQKRDVVERMGGKVRRWIYPWDEIYFDAQGLVVGWDTVY
jgi:hypothetical protein